MAKTRTPTPTATTTNVQLDDSAEHEGLTPLMRRLAAEYWEMVRARAAEQGLPIVRAFLSPYTDVEDRHVVFLAVHFDATEEQARALQYGLSAEHRRWRMQLGPEAHETNMRLSLVVAGLRRPAGAPR